MRGTIPLRRLTPTAENYPRRPQRLNAVGVTVAALLWAATGCAASKHGNMVAFLRAHEQATSTGQYVVMPRDAIRIHAPVAPEVDGTTARVRPDGRIALRLLGEIDIAGLTTEQIADKLELALARFYVDPEVVVDISTAGSKLYNVFCEVCRAGAQVSTGHDTLLDALAASQPNMIAWRSQIRLVRPSPADNEPKTVTIDLDKMVQSGDMTMNFLLQPGDVIYVPPTPLGWVGLRVRELLFPISPVVELYDGPARILDSHDTYKDHWGTQN
jgi:protein involved in polysaccharide export with SLBB domain